MLSVKQAFFLCLLCAAAAGVVSAPALAALSAAAAPRCDSRSSPSFSSVENTEPQPAETHAEQFRPGHGPSVRPNAFGLSAPDLSALLMAMPLGWRQSGPADDPGPLISAAVLRI